MNLLPGKSRANFAANILVTAALASIDSEKCYAPGVFHCSRGMLLGLSEEGHRSPLTLSFALCCCLFELCAPNACSLRPGEWGYSQLAFVSVSLTNEISWLVGGYCDMERQVALDICPRMLSSETLWEPKTLRIWVNFSVLVRLIWPNMMIISVSLLLSNWL